MPTWSTVTQRLTDTQSTPDKVFACRMWVGVLLGAAEVGSERHDLCRPESGERRRGHCRLHAEGAASWKVKISRQGRFSFKGVLPGRGKRQLRFFGKVSGAKADGKIQFSFEQSPGVRCALSGDIRFTARR
jgi:hypothetical protein